jgi:predicted metalloendopeptidase
MRVMGELEAETGVKLLMHSKYTSVPSHDIHDLQLQIVPAQAYKNITLENVQEIMTIWSHNHIITPKMLSKDHLTQDEINDWIVAREKRHLYFVKHLNRKHYGRGKSDQYQTVDSLGLETKVNWKDYLKPLKLDSASHMHLWAEKNAWIHEVIHITSAVERKMLKYFALWRLALAHFNKLSDPYYSLWKNELRKKAIKMSFYSVDTAMTFLRHDCVKETGANLKYLAGHIYVKYAFNGTQKELASEMVDNLFYTLEKRFHQLDWMNESSREAALKKLNNLSKVVGYQKSF